MLPFPPSPDDHIALADWLELAAITSRSSTAPAALLERALKASAQLPDPDQDSQIEEAIGGVFSEITDRTIAAGDAYPLSVADDEIELKNPWESYLPYVFCLVLSYFSNFQMAFSVRPSAYPARWFEQLSRDAAQSYVSGVAVRFGSPREPEELPREFEKAVDFICRHILMEGLGYKAASVPDDKDAGIDIIACRNFPDRLPGKILLFGQCASGKLWKQKIDDLRPDVFIDDWLQESPRSAFLKSLFIPHRIDRPTFNHTTRHAGIIFDRCRIALWAHCLSTSTIEGDAGRKSYFPSDECRNWVAETLSLNGISMT